MIRSIYLDLDDVCNTLAPCVLNAVGCPIGPSDYESYPSEYGYEIVSAANSMLRAVAPFPEAVPCYTPDTFWPRISRSVWATVPESDIFHWLLDTCEQLVGRGNICIATCPTDEPDCLAGKLEWIHAHFPAWMHREYAITPCKWRFARPDALLIDDHPGNVLSFRAQGGHAILVPRPWNEAWGYDPRAYVTGNLDMLLQNRSETAIQL